MNGVATQRRSESFEVVVMGEGLVRPRVVRVAKTDEWIVSFPKTYVSIEGRKKFDTGVVRSMSFGWLDRAKSQPGVIVNLRASVEPIVREVIGGWIIAFKDVEPTVQGDLATLTPMLKAANNLFAFDLPTFATSKPKVQTRPIEVATTTSWNAETWMHGPWFDPIGSSNIDDPKPQINKPKTAEPTTKVQKAGTPKPKDAPRLVAVRTDKPNDPLKRVISLDFTNADVVQVLKAITMQAGVNIVTAPDVKGAITVSLDKVSVLQALDVVTQIAKLSYQKQGSVYMVTNATVATIPKPPQPAEPMIANRIVPILSGDAKEIRALLLAQLASQRSLSGYQFFLPKDNFSIERKAATPDEGASNDVKLAQAGAAAGAVTAGAEQKSDAGSDKDGSYRFNGLREQYLMVIGPAEHLDAVAKMAEDIDRNIARAYGQDVSGNQELVNHTYAVKSDRVSASDLVKAITSNGSNLNVDMVATPKTFVNQAVMIVGREANVKRAETMIQQLDSSGYGNEFMPYEVKFIDPRAAREALVAAIPGLRVTIAPNGAGNPNLFTEGEVKKQGQDVQNLATKDQGTAPKTQAMGATSTTNLSDGALESPFSEAERQAVPMRLLLRGTAQQLDQARQYLAQLDIPSKQVALELRVMELSRDDSLKAGIDWNVLGGGAVKFLRMNNSVSNPSNTIGGNVSGTNFSGDISASLDKLATKGKLIARPNAFVQDGRQGEMFVGEVVRYVQSITNSQNGITVTTGEVPVGVRLSVLVRCGGDGNLTLDIRPRMTILKGFTDVPGGGKLPQTSNRYEQSTVTLQSGQTIAIGGLIQDQDTFSSSGVPLLSDIPLIGHLFKSHNSEKIRTELVFFLTAKVIEGPTVGGNLIMQEATPAAPTKASAKGGKNR